MATIRTFQNADLPAISRVWVEHWSAVTEPPKVSPAIIEQAILSRMFFDSRTLLVAQQDDDVSAWAHYIADPLDPSTAILSAICFSHDGLDHCDELLEDTQQRIAAAGFQRIVVGPFRDEYCGYAGLSPIGHGVGVPATDARVSSLLSRRGFTSVHSVTRMVANTSPYRMPVSREAMQLRRTTRLQNELWIPADPRHASAMAHLDIEQHSLVNHRTSEQLATLAVWFSDPDAQVMDCAETILDLGEIHDRATLTASESFLVGSVVQSLANRRVFRIETAVNSEHRELIEHLTRLQFESVGQGHRWEKHF